jgi:hypothetical protein
MTKYSTPLPALFLACLAVLAGESHSQISEEPVLEVINYRLRAGTNPLGIALQKPALWRGKIGSVSASSRILVDQDSKSAGPILAQLPLEAAYLEITASPLDPTLVGERFEVAVLETRGAAGSLGQIRLRSSPWDTRPDLPPGLAGCAYAIHPHWTLSSFFGFPEKSVLRRARSAASAETVRLPSLEDPQGWESFFILEDRGLLGWRNALRRAGGDAGGRILPPGWGLQVMLISGPERPLVALGERRRHSFRRPLHAGRNLVALGHPGPRSLGSILARQDFGFQAGSGPTDADEIHFQNHGRWEILRYTAGATPGGAPSWKCLTARYGGRLEELPLLPAQQSFWIKKIQADSDFIVPAPTP